MTAENPDAPETDAPDTPPEPPKHDRLPDDHPVVKALAKANEEAKAARLKVKEYEDAEKSETDRLNDQLKEAQSRAEKAEAKVLRAEVAASKGLPAALAKRLSGSTIEELEADADDLLSTFGGDKPSPPTDRRPSEALRPGNGNPAEEPEETDPAKLAARHPRS